MTIDIAVAVARTEALGAEAHQATVVLCVAAHQEAPGKHGRHRCQVRNRWLASFGVAVERTAGRG